MKIVLCNHALVQNGDKWDIVTNASVFTEDDIQVINFDTREELDNFVINNNLQINNDNEMDQNFPE